MAGTRSQPAGYSTQPGFTNRNEQKVVRKTDLPGTDFVQLVYELECTRCAAQYGANGSDIHRRKCPECQGGAPGLAYRS